jgi:hypothetical protein
MAKNAPVKPETQSETPEAQPKPARAKAAPSQQLSAWQSVQVTEEGDFNGAAGVVVRQNEDGLVTVKLDRDSAEHEFAAEDLRVL